MDVTLVVDALGSGLTGIGRYTWELCTRVPDQPGIGRVSYYANGILDDSANAFLDGTHKRRRKRLPRWLRKRVVANRLRDSVVHGPNYFLPEQVESGIVTIHDLSIFRYPQTHPPERLAKFAREFESSLGRATHIITDTETVRRELAAQFAIPEQRISAIALGVDQRFSPRSDEDLRTQLAPFGLEPRAYALCVSTLEPRKKIVELLLAWSELPSHLRNSTPLVLAGGEGWLNEALHELIGDGVAAGWLRHLGFVSEPDLPALYAGSALFLYPSIYEGFGLPPVEAMASGVPVVVANSSCLPEVCGDAAAYVDPDDVDGFSAAIAEALTDSGWRQSAREKGLRRAALFDWDRCASETARIYRRSAP